jgi:amidase
VSELCFSSAGDLAGRIRAGEISSVELTELFIDRIERLDGDINAVVVRRFDAAREAARRADEQLAGGTSVGPLHGVPMTIKESYDLAGLPTTWGHPQFRDNVATADSESVKAYQQAGAIFLGKTNVPINLGDFQSYNEIYGTTGNPWDLERTPGGSSGGAAAALAAGLTGLESGSDIGGSIRNPAHFCGVYGHKPTWGIVPPQGHSLPPAIAGPDIAVCGPLARSADDLALAMDLLAGPEPLNRRGWKLELPRPEKQSLREFRVALWPTDAQAPVSTEIADRVAMVGETLSKLGATVSDRARPAFDVEASHLNYLKLLNSVIGASIPEEAWKRIQQAVEHSNPADTSAGLASLRGAVLSHRDWIRAQNARERLRHAWRDFFDEWDILVCPQMATTAFVHDHSDLQSRTVEVDGQSRPYFEPLFWAGLVTGVYLPSTVFPTGPSAAGLPIGLQAVGAEYDDLRTIDFTRLLAREIGGFVPPPAYSGGSADGSRARSPR